MPSLYELSLDLRHVIDGGLVIDENTGEVLFDSENLDALSLTVAQKAEAVLAVKRDYDTLTEQVDAEIKRLQALKKSYAAHADRLGGYLLNAVDANGGNAFETRYGRIGTRRSESVAIVDEDAIPEEYWKVKTERSLDKVAAKKAIKSGARVPGVALMVNTNLAVK